MWLKVESKWRLSARGTMRRRRRLEMKSRLRKLPPGSAGSLLAGPPRKARPKSRLQATATPRSPAGASSSSSGGRILARPPPPPGVIRNLARPPPPSGAISSRTLSRPLSRSSAPPAIASSVSGPIRAKARPKPSAHHGLLPNATSAMAPSRPSRGRSRSRAPSRRAFPRRVLLPTSKDPPGLRSKRTSARAPSRERSRSRPPWRTPKASPAKAAKAASRDHNCSLPEPGDLIRTLLNT